MPSRRPPRPPAAVHPIQAVARLTGISADLIRVWEKRYGVVAPVRTPTGRRLYSNADVERLRLLGRATLAGYSIRRAAALPADTLAGLARDAAALADGGGIVAGDGAEPADRSPSRAAEHVDACLAAIEQFDGIALDALLRRATVALSAAAFLDALVVPLAARVAARTHDGSLRTPHRHLAHATLRRVLDQLTATAMSPVASPDLVVTTPIGQSEELGALVTAAAAAAEGWRVTYVGAGLSAGDAAEAATLLDARRRAESRHRGGRPPRRPGASASAGAASDRGRDSRGGTGCRGAPRRPRRDRRVGAARPADPARPTPRAHVRTAGA